MLLDHPDAVSRNERPRAFARRGSSPRPNNRAILAMLGDPAAVPFLFQAGFPAFVALPPGLISELGVEGDGQFFLSSSVNPHSRWIAPSISFANGSGPLSISVSTVAAAPSMVRPSIFANPQRRYSFSTSQESRPASTRSPKSSPACRNSAFPAISRICRSSSHRRVKDIRRIVNLTLGWIEESIVTVLVYSVASSECDVKFVIRPSLRPISLEPPLQPAL